MLCIKQTYLKYTKNLNKEEEQMNKRMIKGFVFTLGAVALLTGTAGATPSTTYWTPATSDIQPYKVGHLGIDNYFTIGQKGSTKGGMPTDVGFTVGVLPYEKLQMEVGIDLIEPSESPVFLNVKIGTPEGSLFEGSPAFNLGVFNVGTVTSGADRNDQNIMDVIAGKTLPMGLGRLHLGVYSGNKDLLVDANGKEDNTGFMVGWDMGIIRKKEHDGGEYHAWVFAADYASGKNAIGGGGVGVYHYMTKNISILTGPVWFNEPVKALGNPDVKWVWTTQLDVNF